MYHYNIDKPNKCGISSVSLLGWEARSAAGAAGVALAEELPTEDNCDHGLTGGWDL